MNFVRKKKKGQNAKVRRTWLSAEKYRIVWRKEVFGIAVPARYQACVLEMLPNFAGVRDEWFKSWGFVAKQRLYKTLKSAQADCEKHYRLWTKACEAAGIRALLDLFGKLPIAIPVWVKGKLSRKVYGLLIEAGLAQCEQDQSDQPETSEPSSEASIPSDSTSGPASSAAEPDGETANIGVQPAEEPEPAPAPPARKRTAKSSKSTKRKSVSTKDSSKRAKPRSKGSRKSKSKP